MRSISGLGSSDDGEEDSTPLSPSLVSSSDDEELLEYAMHPSQYEAYRSGQAKTNFEADLAKRKAAQVAKDAPAPAATSAVPGPAQPKDLTITVDGKAYRVSIDYGKSDSQQERTASTPSPAAAPKDNGNLASINAPLEGKFLLTKDSSERGIQVGDKLSVGDTVAYIESMKVINAVTADKAGEIVEIVARHGSDIEEDDVIVRLK